MYDLSALLRGNAYPGRGVLLGGGKKESSPSLANFIRGGGKTVETGSLWRRKTEFVPRPMTRPR